MKKVLITISCFIASLFLMETVLAQILPFRTYSIEQGLSESVVHSLMQDEKGYIWIGTGFGLNRFDGVRFEQFYQEDGLPNNRINTLHQSSDGIIWIGTNSGLAILEDDSISTPDVFEPIGESVIRSVFEDQDRQVWIATERNGLWRYNQKQEFINISQQHGYRNFQARDITQTPDGLIWLGTTDGLFHFNGDTFRKYRIRDGFPGLGIFDLEVDTEGHLWIASQQGLIKKEGDEFRTYHDEYGLNDCRLQSLSISPDQGVWVGSESGVSFFDGNQFTNYTTENGLNAVLVYETLIDREGNVWLGTYGGGANIFLGDLFQNYDVDSGLSNNVITGFEEDYNGNIWIATYGGGILKFDGENFQHFGEDDGLIDDKTYTLFEDRDRRLWIGTESGISIYENGEFNDLPADLFPFGMIRDIYEDEETGDFWFASYNEGVIRFNGEQYEQFDTDSGLLNNTVMNIKKDENGTYWFATYGGVATLKDGTFQHYTTADGLPNNGVIHIHIDHEGQKWFSTFSGIATMIDDEVRSLVADNQSGIISYFTVQDSQNQYWVGTNRGLFKFDQEQFFSADSRVERIKSFKLFDQNQGLITNELNAGASFVASDQTIWLGTVEGLSHFFPERVEKNTSPPGLEFEEIMMSGRVISENEKHQFNHGQNFLQINYTGISFDSPERILYEYRLKGLDDEWQTTRDRTVRYTSLPPNQYEFQLRAYNADGVQSAGNASFSFIIQAPLWQQWWFILLIVLAVIGLILFYYRYFKATKQIDIERMRVQIASDLHDDVGSSLTELALQTDFLRAGDVSDDLRSTLKQLGDQSRKIVSSLDDIVWSIDARNDTAGDMTDRMQDYVNHVFSSGVPEVYYHFDNLRMDDKLPVHVKENIYLIFKESINNIAKHSNADRVDVTFVYDGKEFELQVKDNGSEVNGQRKTGQGLRNIELRSKRIGADVSIKNSDGFTVNVKGIL